MVGTKETSANLYNAVAAEEISVDAAVGSVIRSGQHPYLKLRTLLKALISGEVVNPL